jgi:hypothetical protein
MDPFQSSAWSTILAWVASLLVVAGVGVSVLSFVKQPNLDKRSLLFLLWAVIAMFVFGPARYIVFQLVLATSYPFQSLYSLLTCFVLFFYVPAVAFILYVIGMGLPYFIFRWIMGRGGGGLGTFVFALFLTPWVCKVGSVVFFALLPYAAISVHWLRVQDVMRATNGPARMAFTYFAKWRLADDMSEVLPSDGFLDHDTVRSHVAMVYLGEKQRQEFIRMAH